MKSFFSVGFFRKKQIKLGEQEAVEYQLFEIKPLFSIKLFNFKTTAGKQDRFHTHQFNALSILLWGDYVEELLLDHPIHGWFFRKVKRSARRFLIIPKNTFHRITKAKNCWTLLITGPWRGNFYELRERDGVLHAFECGKGRKDLVKSPEKNLKTKYIMNWSEE